MAVKEELEALANWFGDRPFRVRDMSDDGVAQLVELAEIQLPSPHYGRTRVGLWFIFEDGAEYVLGIGRRVRTIAKSGKEV